MANPAVPPASQAPAGISTVVVTAQNALTSQSDGGTTVTAAEYRGIMASLEADLGNQEAFAQGISELNKFLGTLPPTQAKELGRLVDAVIGRQSYEQYMNGQAPAAPNERNQVPPRDGQRTERTQRTPPTRGDI